MTDCSAQWLCTILPMSDIQSKENRYFSLDSTGEQETNNLRIIAWRQLPKINHSRFCVVPDPQPVSPDFETFRLNWKILAVLPARQSFLVPISQKFVLSSIDWIYMDWKSPASRTDTTREVGLGIQPLNNSRSRFSFKKNEGNFESLFNILIRT